MMAYILDYHFQGSRSDRQTDRQIDNWEEGGREENHKQTRDNVRRLGWASLSFFLAPGLAHFEAKQCDSALHFCPWSPHKGSATKPRCVGKAGHGHDNVKHSGAQVSEAGTGGFEALDASSGKGRPFRATRRYLAVGAACAQRPGTSCRGHACGIIGHRCRC